MIRVKIETRDRIGRGQGHTQNEICDPLVLTEGESLRMKEARESGGRITAKARYNYSRGGGFLVATRGDCK